MKENNKVELLAPAGNKEAFYGAIHAGADAVYLGGSRFGARAYADNFTEEDLISCIRYAHLFGRKVYLTVNTLVKENEFSEIYDYLRPFYEAGLDGVIIQDIGVFAFIREHFPDMELHVSTQMTITGKYSAALLKEMGACRIVPARELSLAEIKEMKAATGLEIETFIHGAMCYCYSGQCLFSSILGGRSGNRGRCAQPCRLPYKVQDGHQISKECYPLSLKDMCTIEHIPELIEAGIDSFKIEGRMKKPEYAAGVTAIYRKYIDKYYKAPQKPFQVSEDDLRKLSCLYIRCERQDGYYYKHNGKEMVTLSQPSYSGSDEALLAAIRRTYLEQSPQKTVTVYGTFLVGQEASVTILHDTLSVTVTGDVVQPAQKQPITDENVKKQLGKLGDSIFHAEQIEITLDEKAFYPLKAINELRRKAVMQLEEQLIESNGFPVSRRCGDMSMENVGEAVFNAPAGNDKADKIQLQSLSGINVSVRTFEQLSALSETLNVQSNQQKTNMLSRIYIDGDLLLDSTAQCLEVLNTMSAENIISLPYILRSKDEAYLKQLTKLAQEHSDVISGFQVRCYEAMGFLKKEGYNGKIYTDAGFYIWNKQTLAEWSDVIDGYCLPHELKSGEQRVIAAMNNACEKVFYGRIPMMITANCVARTTGQCRKGTEHGKTSKPLQLIDRYQKQFPVVLNCRHCMNIIYNSVPLSLHGELSKWQGKADMRLDFTIENAKETKAVLDYFVDVFENRKSGDGHVFPFKDYTTGHEKRGVE